MHITIWPLTLLLYNLQELVIFFYLKPTADGKLSCFIYIPRGSHAAKCSIYERHTSLVISLVALYQVFVAAGLQVRQVHRVRTK